MMRRNLAKFAASPSSRLLSSFFTAGTMSQVVPYTVLRDFSCTCPGAGWQQKVEDI